MGNDQSKQKYSKNTILLENVRKGAHEKEIVRAFSEFSGADDLIHFPLLEAKTGPKLAESLWKFIRPDGDALSLDVFSRNASILVELSASAVDFIRILMPPKHLIDVCLEAQGIRIVNEADDDFIPSFASQMISKGTGAEAVAEWINENCPRLCDPVRNKVEAIFQGKILKPVTRIHSEVLSASQMFILRQSLPTTVFCPKPASQSSVAGQSQQEAEDWLLLYSSASNGLSINRFETNVFEYRGPTLAIFRLCSAELYAIAADEEWRHSCKPFGGPNSMLFKFAPNFQRIDPTQPALYCNFKNRSSKLGLSCGRHLSIDEGFSNVEQIEVWGCAGTEVLDEQRKMKMRHKLQAERNAKVPMPGKWDENADKAILEMGGIKFSNERRDFQHPDHL